MYGFFQADVEFSRRELRPLGYAYWLILVDLVHFSDCFLGGLRWLELERM